MRAGLDGQKAVLYVQLPIGRVLMEKLRVGDHCDMLADLGTKGSLGTQTHDLDSSVP
jgi:hypothetical protein